jgi:hypothetical protein
MDNYIENTDGTIKNGQSREIGNIDEEKHNKECVGHHYTQTNTTGGKNEPNIVFMWKS